MCMFLPTRQHFVFGLNDGHDPLLECPSADSNRKYQNNKWDMHGCCYDRYINILIQLIQLIQHTNNK